MRDVIKSSIYHQPICRHYQTITDTHYSYAYLCYYVIRICSVKKGPRMPKCTNRINLYKHSCFRIKVFIMPVPRNAMNAKNDTFCTIFVNVFIANESCQAKSCRAISTACHFRSEKGPFCKNAKYRKFCKNTKIPLGTSNIHSRQFLNFEFSTLCGMHVMRLFLIACLLYFRIK